jgi:hypothetical protein
MVTLADAIAEKIAEGPSRLDPDPFPPCSDDEKKFLQQWADALYQRKWGLIAKRFEGKESDVVFAVIESLRHAQADDEKGASEAQRDRDKLLGLADMARQLADHYRQLSVFNGAMAMRREFGEYKHLVELHEREAEALRKCARWRRGSSVTVPQTFTGRQERLFVRHLSGWMNALFDTPHTGAVVRIANMIYPDAGIDKAYVDHQRKQMLKK